ncbi:transcription antitermination factor NusB [Pleionea sp. CnH1-48]|uniref:transcription antitermination factor NusB n=1 Tax=Pleionea sp. CnH1-48 TaxID=2954494 RepID=UPI002097650F|nr:transcription antitermination factor NusB [Pleionea sp. CnH1-48]MCO7225736.1 transcription antitermination factor NusB [Pleionea sp. CnH1-48]
MTIKPSLRRKARYYAVQGVYEFQMSGNPLLDIETQFLELVNPKKTDIEYFRELLKGTLTSLATLDEKIAPHLDRTLDEVDPVERSILRIATWELSERMDVPYRVVINEALELAKIFGAEDGHKYVNGVLDNLAKELRPLEVR